MGRPGSGALSWEPRGDGTHYTCRTRRALAGAGSPNPSAASQLKGGPPQGLRAHKQGWAGPAGAAPSQGILPALLGMAQPSLAYPVTLDCTRDANPSAPLCPCVPRPGAAMGLGATASQDPAPAAPHPAPSCLQGQAIIPLSPVPLQGLCGSKARSPGRPGSGPQPRQLQLLPPAPAKACADPLPNTHGGFLLNFLVNCTSNA